MSMNVLRAKLSAASLAFALSPGEPMASKARTISRAPRLALALAIIGAALLPSAPFAAGSTATDAPMVSIVNPASGTVVSPDPGFKVQIRVFNMVGNRGIDGVSSVELSADDGATYPYTATANTRYDAIFDDPAWATTVTGRTFEVVVSGLAQGTYTLRARAVNSVPRTVTSEPARVVVAAAGTGDGNLLVRDNSAQLCTDCHAVQTHSSEAVGMTYGAWATTCRDCHTPHRTRNVALVRESITPPSVNGAQTAKNVGFVKFTGDSNAAGWDTTNARPTPDASFVNTTDRSGPCQICHTRTVNPANGFARWRNTGNSDPHWVAPSTVACTGCHSHKNGFAAGESTGGAACASCHQPIWNAMTGVTAGLASKHQLGTVAGTNDSPTDSGVDWDAPAALGNVAPAQRSCVNMCHGDHPHDIQADTTTHGYDLYLDPLTATSRGNTATRTTSNRTRTDFDPVTNTGMCARCHSKPVATGGITLSAPAFGASAHDFTAFTTPSGTTYTWQYTLHKGTTARNCTKCHASRAEGTTPTSGASGSSASAVHGTTDDSLLAGTKNPAGTAASFVCYNCHGSTASPANGAQGNRSGKNVQAQIAKTYNHPTNSDAVHDSASEYAGTKPATRHVSCMDCHDTHQATAANPLQGAPGVRPTNSGTPGGTPTAYTFERITDPSHQYKTCFRCHTDWNGFGTGTNVAIEFNPNNESLHRVEADQGTVPVNTTGTGAGIWQNATFNSATPTGQTLTYAQIMMPGRASYTDATLRALPLRCSDCHGDNAADGGVNVPEGPHGSTNQRILKIPAGSTYTVWNSTVQAGATNVWCFNCHSPTFVGTGFAGGGNLHTSQHNGKAACQQCHLANPHGERGSGATNQRKHLLTPATFSDTIDDGAAGRRSGSYSQGAGHAAVLIGCT